MISQPQPQPQLLIIGKVTRPHGIAGEIKVQLAPEYIDVIGGVQCVYVDDSMQPYRVLSQRVHQGALLLKIEGVQSRNDAEALRGASVAVHLEDLPELNAGEYYTHELLGLRVVDESGNTLGELVEVLATGSNDVYIVDTAEGELLLPAIESVVREIDLDAGVMQVVVPNGLLPAKR